MVIKSKKNISITSYDDFAAADDTDKGKVNSMKKKKDENENKVDGNENKQPLPKPNPPPQPKPTLKPGDRVDITQLLFTRDYLAKPTLKPGDRVDITQLLFTKQRDYLIKSNSNQLVKADHLQGKVIVLFFASVYHDDWFVDSYHLTQVYNDIYHYSPFEVVFVALAHPPSYPPPLHPFHQSPHPLFDSIFSTMPWTAIPYSDLASRELLQDTFGFNGTIMINSPIIDPSGLVLCLYANSLFSSYGSPAYPFTDQRLRFLDSQDRALLQRPSITELLTSPKRDYLLSNNGVKVPVLSLQNKVVALHFFEEGGTFLDITDTLVAAYKDLVKKHDDFEVVLIYLHDSWTTLGRTSEDSFWKKFKTMPWLALPYKDPVCKRLMRVFNYPYDFNDLDQDQDPRLVVVGPRGEFCEPFAADIFMDFGTEAYPFTRKNML